MQNEGGDVLATLPERDISSLGNKKVRGLTAEEKRNALCGSLKRIARRHLREGMVGEEPWKIRKEATQW